MSGSAADVLDEAVALVIATLAFGVRRLGEWVQERSEVEHEFVDIPNPV